MSKTINQYLCGDSRVSRRLIIAKMTRRRRKTDCRGEPTTDTATPSLDTATTDTPAALHSAIRDVPARPGQGRTDFTLLGEVLERRGMEIEYERPAWLPDEAERVETEAQVSRALYGGKR